MRSWKERYFLKAPVAVEIQIHVYSSIVINDQHPCHIGHVDPLQRIKKLQIFRIVALDKLKQISIIVHFELMIRVYRLAPLVNNRQREEDKPNISTATICIKISLNLFRLWSKSDLLLLRCLGGTILTFFHRVVSAGGEILGLFHIV